MSIYVQQPHRTTRRLSGLGAFAAMHTQVLQEGTGAFLNDDVCDFEALVQRVAAQLGMRGEYAGKPALAQHDAAIYAHEIYEANCPSAQTYVENNYYGGWWGGGGGGRRRRRHGGHPHDMVAHSAPSTMDVHAMPASRSSAPVSLPHRYMTQAAPPMQHRSFAHARVQAQNASQAQRSRGPSRGSKSHLRGLGDGEQIPGLMFDQRLNRTAPPRTVQPQTITAIQDRVTAVVAPQVSWASDAAAAAAAAATATDGSSMPSSFSIEGALPGGVALLLGAAIGLLGVSFLGGK